MVAHRERKQDRDKKTGPRPPDALDLLETEQIGADAVLEDQHAQAVGRTDRQQLSTTAWRR